MFRLSYPHTTACGTASVPTRNRTPPPHRPPCSPGEPRWQSITGMKTTYRVVQEGRAPAVAKRASVTVHATGVVRETGKKFWSTKDPGQQPFSYQAGVGKVIPGWDQGCLGMKTGEVREIVIPAKEGYGERGFPAWGIPPGGTLVFTIEVLKIAA